MVDAAHDVDSRANVGVAGVDLKEALQVLDGSAWLLVLNPNSKLHSHHQKVKTNVKPQQPR